MFTTKRAWSPCRIIWVALVIPWISEGCMQTIYGGARHDSSQEIAALTLGSPEGGSCMCCALCHQNPACASLSFSAASGECLLYSSVASYATIQPDDQWEYFVMPGRSQHNQFCRNDSDCLEGGDFCRASVCTELEAVTCRVIHETFGLGQRLGAFLRVMEGWLNDAPLPLTCWMLPDQGYTCLMWSKRNDPFTRDNILSRNEDIANLSMPYSILGKAEDIRLAGRDSTYRIRIRTASGSSFAANGVFPMVDIEAPRDEAVLSSTPRRIASPGPITIEYTDMSETVAQPVMPWMPRSGNVLLTITEHGADYGDVADSDQVAVNGDLARTDGIIRLGGKWIQLQTQIKMYIYE